MLIFEMVSFFLRNQSQQKNDPHEKRRYQGTREGDHSHYRRFPVVTVVDLGEFLSRLGKSDFSRTPRCTGN